MNKKYYLLKLLVIFLITSCSQKASYIKNSGFIQGTTYSFIYESPKGIDFQKELENELKRFDGSLSNYQTNSIISRMNHNDSTVLADELFEACFERAMEISEITDGAFDLTVGPLVNAWGFGFEDDQAVGSTKIDSLMQFVGFQKIKLANRKLIKENKDIKVDVNAIAQGYSVDVIVNWLEHKNIENYLVEIGGEVRAKGINGKGIVWKIGIDKPIEDQSASNRELQAIASLNNKSLATSGNYRKFYEKDGIKYSHTINPKTGYPARNTLLSASVLATDCMTADAFATAFMVLGVEKSIELANKLYYI
jgi:thiamine biosynthesis lipoprotein